MKQFEQFKKLIDDKRFYEAHEALEEVWFPIRFKKNDCCLVLKGFINGAVSLELYKRGKIKQSKFVYKTYQKHTNSTKIDKTDNQKKFKQLKVFMDKKFENIFKNQPKAFLNKVQV